MNKPLVLPTERNAIRNAIAALRAGSNEDALKLLRRALVARKAPAEKPSDILLLRASIEKAIGEIEHGEPAFALRTLQRVSQT